MTETDEVQVVNVEEIGGGRLRVTLQGESLTAVQDPSVRNIAVKEASKHGIGKAAINRVDPPYGVSDTHPTQYRVEIVLMEAI